MREQPIRVLLFTNTSARGGAEEHMLTLLRGFDRERFRLFLVCPPEVAAMLRDDLPADVELLPLCLQKPSQIRAAFQLARILRQRGIAIVHSHRFYSSLFAAPVAWLCGIPVFIETPHLSERWRQGWFTSRFVVDRIIGSFVDYYIAVSHANGAYLSQEKGLPRRKISVIQNGCDLARFDPNHVAPAGMKMRLGFAESDPVLVVSARLEPQKGHEVLLRALPKVLAEFPRTRLVCLGEGNLRSELESQVTLLGVGDAVRFLGYRQDTADWLALANFTVLPSLWEGLPLTAIESLAAGRAVVATAVDGTPEVVVDGETGFTVPPSEPAPLADAILRLLRDPDLCKRMGATGRKLVEKKFSEERQIRDTQDLYLRAMRESRAGGRMRELPRVHAEGIAASTVEESR